MAEKAVIEKTPLWYILFCISSGLLIVLSFPFDIFALDTQNGIILTSTTPQTAIEQFNDNFKPFIMVKHLRDTTYPYAGLVEIILLGLVIGTLAYLFLPVSEKINSVVADNIRKTRFRRIVRSKDSPDANKKVGLELAQVPRFIKWLHDTNSAGYADFTSSMAKLTEGLLLGAETFFLLNILRILSVGIQYLYKASSVGLSNSIESMAWFDLSLILVLVFYYIYMINQRKFRKDYGNWVEAFKTIELETAYA